MRTCHLVSRINENFMMPPSEPIIPGAECIEQLRVLGVLLNTQLPMGDHIDRAVSSCASLKFALRTLRAHGLRPQELHLVARATTVASLQYASPPWWGVGTEEQRNGLERLLRGLRRCGFLPVDFPSFAALATEADLRLLKSISANPYHVLRHSVRIAGGLGVESPYLIL